MSVITCWLVAIGLVLGVVFFSVGGGYEEYNGAFKSATCLIQSFNTTEKCRRFHERTGECRYNSTFLTTNFLISNTNDSIFRWQTITNGYIEDYNKGVEFLSKHNLGANFTCYWRQNPSLLIFQLEKLDLYYAFGIGFLSISFLAIAISTILSFVFNAKKRQEPKDNNIVLNVEVICEQQNLQNVDKQSVNVIEEPTPAKHECAICVNTLCEKKFVKTVCNHYFHKTCFLNWRQKNASCAMCRHPLVTLKRKRKK